MPGNDSLAFSGITFRYGRRPAVLSGFDWVVDSGRTVLLGPNGAGKTTLLGLAADVLAAQAGSVTYGAYRANSRSDRARYRASIGWMPQTVSAVRGLNVREQVAYAGWLKGLSRGASWSRAAVALDRVGLLPLSDRLATEISGGELRRVWIAQMLVHEATLFLLDEPTVGLDPAQRAVFRELVGGLGANSTVLVSTHQVDDLSSLFENVAVIDRGTFRYQGTVPDFLALADSAQNQPGEAAYARVLLGSA